MIDVEGRYFSHKGAISVLIGISFSLLSFNAVFNTFYCFGFIEDIRNLLFFRYSIYLLASYLLLYILYRISIRYIGFSYPLVTCFTAISFTANAVSGYILSRASFSWTVGYLIENPIGFEPYARRAYTDAISNLLIIIVIYAIISIIPAFRRRTIIVGRFWLVNILTPLLILIPIVLVTISVPEEERINYASRSIVSYLTLMSWYSIRFYLKTIYFLLLLPSKRRMRLVTLSNTRYMALVNRKPRFFRRHIPLLSDQFEPINIVPPINSTTEVDVTKLPLTYPFSFEIIEGDIVAIDTKEETTLDLVES